MLHIDYSQMLEMVHSDDWPQAVDPDLICHEGSEGDQKIRAEGIIEFCIGENLKSKNVLDFGCGPGYVAKQMLERSPSAVVGYDIQKHKEWSKNDLCTDDWLAVVKQGPFQVVLMHDVLDHSKENPADIMKAIRSVTTHESRIYIRLHPWTSRHGTHLYTRLNKAYLHMVLPEKHIKTLGLKEIYTRKVLNPTEYYKKIFADCGFEITHSNLLSENMEHYFDQKPIISAIKKHWHKQNEHFDQNQLQICFLDYILRTL